MGEKKQNLFLPQRWVDSVSIIFIQVEEESCLYVKFLRKGKYHLKGCFYMKADNFKSHFVWSHENMKLKTTTRPKIIYI